MSLCISYFTKGLCLIYLTFAATIDCSVCIKQCQQCSIDSGLCSRWGSSIEMTTIVVVHCTKVTMMLCSQNSWYAAAVAGDYYCRIVICISKLMHLFPNGYFSFQDLKKITIQYIFTIPIANLYIYIHLFLTLDINVFLQMPLTARLQAVLIPHHRKNGIGPQGL